MKKEERRVRRVFASFDKEIVPLAESFTLFLFRATLQCSDTGIESTSQWQ